MSKEVALVNEIEKHPCLYNFNRYKKSDSNHEAWAEVAANLNLTVDECKKSWKHIRSGFVRSLKHTPSSDASRRPYYLSSYLQFLLPFLKSSTSSNEVNSSDEESLGNPPNDDNSVIKAEAVSDQEYDPLDTEVENALQEAKERCERRERRQRMMKMMKDHPVNVHYRSNLNRSQPSIQSARIDSTAMKYFLLSLMPELENMNEDQTRTFKIKVMMLIDNIKTNNSQLKTEFSSVKENQRIQKQLINLLIKK